MSEQYDPAGRYDVIDQRTGDKVGEVVRGVLYEGAPDFRQEAGEIKVVGEDQGLTFSHNGWVFELVPQKKA